MIKVIVREGIDRFYKGNGEIAFAGEVVVLDAKEAKLQLDNKIVREASPEEIEKLENELDKVPANLLKKREVQIEALKKEGKNKDKALADMQKKMKKIEDELLKLKKNK